MKLKICLLFLSIAFLIGFTETASAQQPPGQLVCNNRATFIKGLGSERWQEGQIFLGIINPKVALEIFVNKETQTWTAITSRTDGFSCVLATGQGIKIFDSADSEDE